MGSSKAWLLLLQVIHALINLYNSYRRDQRVDAVRTDPGSEWVRKFGGADKRPDGTAPGAENSRGNSDQ